MATLQQTRDFLSRVPPSCRLEELKQATKQEALNDPSCWLNALSRQLSIYWESTIAFFFDVRLLFGIKLRDACLLTFFISRGLLADLIELCTNRWTSRAMHSSSLFFPEMLHECSEKRALARDLSEEFVYTPERYLRFEEGGDG